MLEFAFILTGMLTGTASGMLGIGGGIIAVPALLFLFKYSGLADDHLMFFAVGTALAAMIFNTLTSMIFHLHQKAILMKVVLIMLPGVIIGSFLGPYFAQILPSRLLQIFFGIVAIVLAVRFFRKKIKVPGKERIHLPNHFVLVAVSFCIAFFSAMIGLAGGFLTVPFLNAYHISIHKSIGSSSFLSFCITCMGAFSFFLFGYHATNIPHALGYIYMPAFLFVGLVSMLFAPLGVKLVHRFPSKMVRYIFGSVLIIAGLSVMTNL